MDVTMATRFTSADFMALMTLRVPSVSMVLPTSLVLPPRDTTTPVMSEVMTFATSAALVTSPWTTVRLGSTMGWPSADRTAVAASFEGARQHGHLSAALERLDHALGAGAAGAAEDDDVTCPRGWRRRTRARAHHARGRTSSARGDRGVGATAARAPIAEESVEAADIGTVPGNARVA